MTQHPDTTTIDIHAHYRAPGQQTSPPPSWATPERRATQARHNEIISSFARIVEASDEAGVTTRVLSLPAASLSADWDNASTDLGLISDTNDYLAGGVRDHPGRILGLATVDAFSGELGAAETRRAVEQLGLSGIVVDSGKADRFLGIPETLPTLQEAALLGIPVFVHPVQTGLNPKLAEHAGILGNSLGRGVANGVALLGLIHRGVLDDLAGLRIVFTTLGLGALAIAGTWREHGPLLANDGRWQVYYDTMGFDAANVAYTVSILGAERVLLGSDFPHQVDATTQRVAAALDGAGLSAHDQALIRSANAANLLQRHPVAAPSA